MYYKITFMTWLSQTRRAKQIAKDPRAQELFDEKDEKDKFEVVIDVETIIEVTSEEDSGTEIPPLSNFSSFDAKRKRR